jgi:hypothetical protein
MSGINRARGVRAAAVAALVAAGMVAVAPAPAVAAVIGVGCSPTELVNAVNTANATPATPDTITLTAGCTYTFTAPHNHWYGPNALPPIASTITIEGNGAVIERDAAAIKFRLFFVGADPTRAETLDYTSPGAGNLTLSNLTVRGGLAKGGAGATRAGGGAGMGGAIFNQGRVTLSAATLTANTAQGGPRQRTAPRRSWVVVGAWALTRLVRPAAGSGRVRSVGPTAVRHRPLGEVVAAAAFVPSTTPPPPPPSTEARAAERPPARAGPAVSTFLPTPGDRAGTAAAEAARPTASSSPPRLVRVARSGVAVPGAAPTRIEAAAAAAWAAGVAVEVLP